MNNFLKVFFLGVGVMVSILVFSNLIEEVYVEYLVWYIRDDFC